MAFPTIDQYAGCLVGQALGDALGFPVEGQGPAACRRYLAIPLGDVGRDPFPFGQYTDDTQLARELLDSWVAHRRFHAEDYASRIATLFATHRVVGGGLATRRAAERLAQGMDWRDAGEPPPAAGNGSAMRAAPVGLLCVGDLDRLVVVAADQSRMTHADPRCLAGSVAIAGAVALVLRGADRSWRLLDAVAGLVDKVHAPFGASVRWLADVVGREPEDAAPRVADRDRVHDDGWPGISPYVVGSVLWSLYAYLRARESDLYEDTVRIAIGAGGDVDTTAAMAGAIAGARVGLRGLPAIASRVTDQGTWGHAELAELTTRAWRLATKAC